MTILRNTPAHIAKFPCSCAVRRAAKLFPAIFSIFISRMLERSTHLIKERGGGSLTALPVIETTAQDISAYNPDQSYFDHGRTDLPFAYAFPTRDSSGGGCRQIRFRVGRSGTASCVSLSCRTLSSSITRNSRNWKHSPSSARRGLDESTRKIIDHGQHIRACLKQAESRPVSMVDQITVLLALTTGLFDRVPIDRVMDSGEGAASDGRGYPGRRRAAIEHPPKN